MNAYKIKSCAKCGVEFQCLPGSGNSTTKYCPEHRTTNVKPRLTETCLVCGGDMSHKVRSAKYCSTSCGNRLKARSYDRGLGLCDIPGCDKFTYRKVFGSGVEVSLCGSHSRIYTNYNFSDPVVFQLLYTTGCLICGTTECRQFNIDHDHSCCPTGKKSCGRCVRGVLCTDCNFGVGFFRDDIDLLKRAIEYLSKSEDNKRIREGRLI